MDDDEDDLLCDTVPKPLNNIDDELLATPDLIEELQKEIQNNLKLLDNNIASKSQ